MNYYKPQVTEISVLIEILNELRELNQKMDSLIEKGKGDSEEEK